MSLFSELKIYLEFSNLFVFTLFFRVAAILLANIVLKVLGPIALGALFLFVVFIACFCVGVLLGRWFGYTIFLVYIGGVLVLFSYMCALNIVVIKKKIGVKNVKNNRGLVFVVVIYYNLRSNTQILSHVMRHFSCLPDKFYLMSYNSAVGMGLSWVVFLVCILFFVIVSVVKICQINSGPLREVIFSSKK